MNNDSEKNKLIDYLKKLEGDHKFSLIWSSVLLCAFLGHLVSRIYFGDKIISPFPRGVIYFVDVLCIICSSMIVRGLYKELDVRIPIYLLYPLVLGQLYLDSRTNLSMGKFSILATFLWAFGYPYSILLPFSKRNIIKTRVEVLKKLVKAEPNNFMAYFNLGFNFIDLKDYHKAIEAFEKAEELKPDDALVKYNLGYVHQCIKNYDVAKKYYQQYINIDPQVLGTKENLVRSYSNLGYAYEGLKNKSKAKEFFEKSGGLRFDKNINLEEEVKQFIVHMREFIDS